MKKIILILVMLLLYITLFAESYRVNVRRVDSNMYEANRGDVLIITKYCYEYAYGDDAILQLDYYNSKLIFENTECDVKEVYAKTRVPAGDYEVTVTRREKDWYEINGKDIFIKTRYCYEYAYSEDVVLSWNGYGGELIFGRNNSYQVEAIFERIQD